MVGSVSTCRARVDASVDSWDVTSCVTRPTHRHGWHRPIPAADTNLIVDADAWRRVRDGHANAAQHGASGAWLELGGTNAGHIAGVPRTRETRSHFAADWSSVPTSGHLSSRRTQPWPRCLTGRDSSFFADYGRISWKLHLVRVGWWMPNMVVGVSDAFGRASVRQRSKLTAVIGAVACLSLSLKMFSSMLRKCSTRSVPTASPRCLGCPDWRLDTTNGREVG